MLSDRYTFYEPGLYKYFCYFRGNVRHGDSALFNRDQTIIYRHYWVDGRGFLAESDDDCTVSRVMSVYNDLLHGKLTEYYDFNKRIIKSFRTYRQGVLAGHYCEFSYDGDTTAFGTYQDGVLHGIQYHLIQNEHRYHQYHEYVKGVLHGESTLYNDYGEVVLRQSWTNGQLAQAEEINAIGLHSMALYSAEDTCSLCYYTRPLFAIQCNHQFCSECIHEWFTRCNQEQRPSSCPICRHAFS